MEIDIITIVVCSVLILSAVITSLCNGFFRIPKKREGDGNADGKAPQLSIVIAAHDNAEELKVNLPLLLSQQYPAEFEVIVVDESSSDETDDVLTLLKNEYSNLYTTFIPQSSHYLSRRKLALTVGVKAARYEWIIFTDADCAPDTDQWLATMAQSCTVSNDIVIGYTNYDSESKAFYRFDQLLTALYSMRQATRKYAYRACGGNLAVRKSTFMKSNGFLQNLKYLRGEYDFMVNEYCRPGRTAISPSPTSFMHRNTPSRKSWLNTKLYYMETRKHLSRSRGYRSLFNTDMMLLHLNYILELSAIAGSLISANYILTAVAAVSLILTVAIRTIICKKALDAFSEQIPIFKIPFFEIGVIFVNAQLMLRHRMSDRYDFIRK